MKIDQPSHIVLLETLMQPAAAPLSTRHRVGYSRHKLKMFN